MQASREEAIVQVNRGRFGSLVDSKINDESYLVTLRTQVLDWLEKIDESIFKLAEKESI